MDASAAGGSGTAEAAATVDDYAHGGAAEELPHGAGDDAPAAKRRRVADEPCPAPVALPAAQPPQAPPPPDPSRVTLQPAGHPLSLPEGWLDCPAVGALCFDLFVPCKVPLGRRFNAVLHDESLRFDPARALAAAASHPPGGRERQVVAVLDLTKTRRYNSPEEWTELGVPPPLKVPCSGSDGAPTPLEVNTFCVSLLNALSQWRPPHGNARVQPVVLVHCTHGFNRTGAMLVHYAMRFRPWPDLRAALGHFAACRAPGIYKDDYIESLFDYYHEVRSPGVAPCPERPPWKLAPQGPPPLRDEDVPEGDLWGMDNETYMTTRAVSIVPMPDEDGVAARELAAASGVVQHEGPPRHDDLLGEEVPPELALQVLSAVRGILQLPPPAAGVDFPGSQPVSLARGNAPLLADPALHYTVSWKADGTRYLMLLLHGGAYLIDRAARVRRCQMRFPMPRVPPRPGAPPGAPPAVPRVHHGVLLDGEMVVDALTPGGPPAQRRFLVYDCCSLGAYAAPEDPQAPLFWERNFMERWEAVEAYVIRPMKEYERQAGQRYRAADEPFRMRRKDFFGIERAEWLLRTLMPQLTHPCDGLIFQPGAEPYVPRTNEHLLKWKDPRMNSVDFYLHEEPSGERFLAVSGGSDAHLKTLADVALPPQLQPGEGEASPLSAPFVTDAAEEGEERHVQHGCIAECVWDGARGAWSLLRVRQDKAHPNHESVFVRVWQSICDNLTADDVLRLLEPAKAARKAKHEAGQAAARAGLLGKRLREDDGGAV